MKDDLLIFIPAAFFLNALNFFLKELVLCYFNLLENEGSL